jgi:hypothetical protein
METKLILHHAMIMKNTVEWFKWRLSIHPSIRPSCRPSVRPSVGRSVRPSVRPSVNFGCTFCNRKAYSISSGIMVMPHVNSDQKQKITPFDLFSNVIRVI